MAQPGTKGVCWICLLAAGLLGGVPGGLPVTAQIRLPQEKTGESRFQAASVAMQNVRRLRLAGQHDEAAQVLESMLAEYSRDEGILRRVYVDLVFTFLEVDRVREAERIAEESLLRYPDLRGGEASYPPTVNEFYDGIRGQMFGSFALDTDPSSCEVYLGSLYLGATPVQLRDMPAGRHEVRLTKTGYEDSVVPLDIVAGGHTVLNLPLEKPDRFHRRRVRPGLDLGLSFVSLSYVNDSSSDFLSDKGQTRFSIGGFVDLALAPNVFLSPGLRYVRLGNKARFDTPFPRAERETVQEYLSMPLLVKAFPFSSSGFFLTGGLEAGLLTDAEQLITGGGKEDLFVRDYNLALDLGAGIEDGYLGHSAFIHFQLSLGLQPVFDTESTNWRTVEVKISTGFIL